MRPQRVRDALATPTSFRCRGNGVGKKGSGAFLIRGLLLRSEEPPVVASIFVCVAGTLCAEEGRQTPVIDKNRAVWQKALAAETVFFFFCGRWNGPERNVAQRCGKQHNTEDDSRSYHCSRQLDERVIY